MAKRFRLLRPPLMRGQWIWPASLALAVGLQAWVAKVSAAAGGVGPLELVTPLMLLGWLLFHQRPEGFSRWSPGYGQRARLRTLPATPTDARRAHKVFAGRYLRARLGPIWTRCAVASAILAWWMATLGWLRLDVSERALRAPLGAQGPYFLIFFVFVAGCCVFASHLCVWEGLKLSARRPSRLEAWGAFWRGLGWSLASQFMAGVFSLAFWALILMFVGYFALGRAMVTTFETPWWADYLTTPKRPRPELLMLALPGMVGQALRDWLFLREQVVSRLSMLALEVARERGAPGAGTDKVRRRVASR